MLLGAGLLSLSSCGSSRSAPTAAAPPRANAQATAAAALVGRPQAAVLRLPRGHSTAKFVITAVPHDTWDVRISAPASADFEVDALKSDGELLHLLETTQQREGCAITGTRLRCFMRFAIGANQAPGRWTVIAKKRTEPAATVRIGVTFNLTETG